jgi:hypothetical protein
MRKLYALAELVLFVVCDHDARPLPNANKERERGELNRQTLGEFEQLLLPLEELVDDEKGDCPDG